MAVGDPQLRYATNTFDADGTTTDWEITFSGGYIHASDVGCFSVVVDPATGLATDRTLHTTEIISSSGNAATVRVSPAVANGRTIVIYRDTQKTSMLVQYQDGSVISKKNLDLSNKQLLMLIQEILDGQNVSAATVEEIVSQVVDVQQIVTDIYNQVTELLEAGGIVSVTPRVWNGIGDGETTDFEIEGADVDGAGFYDTYLEGEGLEPDVDYAIILATDEDPTKIRFTVPPPDGTRWFTVLRGYAKPYTGPQPVVSLRLKVSSTDAAVYYFSLADETSLIRSLNSTEDEAVFYLTVIPESGAEDSKLNTGSYISVKQAGSAQVVIAADDPSITLDVPAGYLPKTRALNSVISVTCEAGDSNLWVVSGDLAKEE